jgi:hypothetical protein
MRFNIKIDENFISYQLEPFMSMHSIPLILSNSDLGKWLNDRNIQYDLNDGDRSGYYKIDIDVEAEAVEFLLSWGDIICTD